MWDWGLSWSILPLIWSPEAGAAGCSEATQASKHDSNATATTNWQQRVRRGIVLMLQQGGERAIMTSQSAISLLTATDDIDNFPPPYSPLPMTLIISLLPTHRYR
jgi:hypothetical protein